MRDGGVTEKEKPPGGQRAMEGQSAPGSRGGFRREQRPGVPFVVPASTEGQWRSLGPCPHPYPQLLKASQLLLPSLQTGSPSP